MAKHSLLIIDDKEHILSSLKKLIEDADTEVFTAKDAIEGEALLKEKGEMEIIICDNNLPGILGIDFLTKIKRLYPDTIRILITGYPDLNSAMEAINKAYVWRYLLKPIEVDELKILVREAFSHYWMLRLNRTLLQAVRRQVEWLKTLKAGHPQMIEAEFGKEIGQWLDKKALADLIKEFSKKYYPEYNEGRPIDGL